MIKEHVFLLQEKLWALWRNDGAYQVEAQVEVGPRDAGDGVEPERERARLRAKLRERNLPAYASIRKGGMVLFYAVSFVLHSPHRIIFVSGSRSDGFEPRGEADFQ